MLIGFLSRLNGISTPMSTEHNQTNGNEPIHQFLYPFPSQSVWKLSCLLYGTQFSSLGKAPR